MSSLMVCLSEVKRFIVRCCCPTNRDMEMDGYNDDKSTLLMFDLSAELEAAMVKSGFTKANIDFHLNLIAYLEEEFSKKEREKMWKIGGSYGEGWGFNLSCMDGTVAPNSNVNNNLLIKFGGHFKNCSCIPAPTNPIITVTEIGDGYCQGAFGKEKDQPVTTYPNMASTPNVEECLALSYSCLPASCTLFSIPRLSEELLQRCKQAGVIIVNARRPWEVRQEFRISYALMEKEIVRTFSEVFGQSLVFLKFIIKTRLKGFGLKSYVAKTLMFNILAESEETLKYPSKGSLLDIVQRAIRLLIHHLQSYKPERDEVCMPNFFQEDVPILFRSTERPNKKDLIMRLEAEIDLIEETVVLFMRQLKAPVSSDYWCQYGSIFPAASVPVHTLLGNRVLKNLDDTFPLPSYVESVQSHWQDISSPTATSPTTKGPLSVRLTVEKLSPKYHTVRLALEVILLVEEGYQEKALSILRDSLKHKPELLQNKSKLSKEEQKQELNKYFQSSDCNWCLYFKNRHSEFLPKLFHELFIRKEVVINFKAVFNVLRRQMIAEQFKETDWYTDLETTPFPDAQEIFGFAMTCQSAEYLKWSLEKLEQVPCHEKQKETMCKSISARLENISKKSTRYYSSTEI